MKVDELISRLHQFDPEATVVTYLTYLDADGEPYVELDRGPMGQPTGRVRLDGRRAASEIR